MRVRVQASTSRPAALALARLLRVTPREALALLARPRVLPVEFDPVGAEAACTALRAQGVEAAAVEVPPTTRRCEAHPSLTGEGPCEDCRALVCALCLPLCRACSARRASAGRWKGVRVAVLLLVLLSVAGFGLLRQRRLDRRNAWLRPVRVCVVLVSAQPVGDEVVAAWSEGLVELEGWFSSEAQRLGLPLEQPLHFELAPVIVPAEGPRPPSSSGDWLTDSQEAIGLRSTLKKLAGQGRAAGLFDLQLVVALRPAAGDHWVEGLGEAGGEVGLVEGTAGDTTLLLELVAVAHEVLHCLGAKDGYDAGGHALPRGLVEPEAGFPQRFAEVMVGEVPLAEAQGRPPKSLAEVRLGEVTAREIGWPGE